MAEVRLEGVDKHYGEAQALHDVTLGVDDGEFCVFVGPSGCGKSTLLRCIAGLEGITAGAVRIGGRDVTRAAPSERGVAMVFQSYALYPNMSVRQNMEFGMRVNGVDAAERRSRVERAAGILQLTELLERRPAHLSGGQRQRVAIGRAIVREPAVFLFDEPLSNLDAKLRMQMRVELEGLHRELGATMIYVTHDQVEAMTMADRIVVLNAGRVEQVGPPMELYHRPRTLFVADFIGAPSMNILPVTAEGGALRYGASAIPEAAPGAVRMGVRPEHLGVVAPGAGTFDARVAIKESLGGESYLHADTPGGDRIVIRTHGDDPTRGGDVVGIALPPDRLHLFDAAGANLSAPAGPDVRPGRHAPPRHRRPRRPAGPRAGPAAAGRRGRPDARGAGPLAPPARPGAQRRQPRPAEGPAGRRRAARRGPRPGRPVRAFVPRFARAGSADAGPAGVPARGGHRLARPARPQLAASRRTPAAPAAVSPHPTRRPARPAGLLTRRGPPDTPP